MRGRWELSDARPAIVVSNSGCGQDKLERILHVLAEELQARGKLDQEEVGRIFLGQVPPLGPGSKSLNLVCACPRQILH